jgi:hypothetical protein
MSKKKESICFGFNPTESKHHFLIVIPKTATAKVLIYERFDWNREEGQKKLAFEKSAVDTPRQKIDQRFDRLKCELSKKKWKEIESTLRTEFNQHLLKHGQKSAKWKTGQNFVHRLFGKELTLLCWAIEDCDIKVIPVAIKNWQGLKPEERWWLYTMTNASTGESHTKYGWRTAIRYALTENPITAKNRQLNLFDQYINDTIDHHKAKS